MITVAFGGGNGKNLIVDASELTGRSEPIYCADFSLGKSDSIGVVVVPVAITM
jgi:hypothetical protein